MRRGKKINIMIKLSQREVVSLVLEERKYWREKLNKDFLVSFWAGFLAGSFLGGGLLTLFFDWMREVSTR